MWETLWENLPSTLLALGTLVAAVVSSLISLRNSRKAVEVRAEATRAAVAAEKAVVVANLASDNAEQKMIYLDGQIRLLGAAVDGRLSDLLKKTEEAAKAVGRLEGRAEQKTEIKAETAATATVASAAADKGLKLELKLEGHPEAAAAKVVETAAKVVEAGADNATAAKVVKEEAEKVEQKKAGGELDDLKKQAEEHMAARKESEPPEPK